MVGPEPKVIAENEKSVDSEGEWEKLGMLYVLLNGILAGFWVDWKGRELEDIVGSFLCKSKDERKKKVLGIHKKLSHMLTSYVLVLVSTLKIHNYAIPTWALGHYTTAYLCGLYS